MPASDNRNTHLALLLALIAVALLCLVSSCDDSGHRSPQQGASDQASEGASGPATSAPDHDSNEIAALQALGYVEWIKPSEENEGKVGVTLHESSLTRPGYNLFNSRPRNHIVLIDMDANVRHEWRVPKVSAIQLAKISPTGDLFVLVKNKELIKLAWHGQVQWRFKTIVHHDMEVRDPERILVLTRKFAETHYKGATLPIVEDMLTILSPDGDVLRELSLLELFRHLVPESRIMEMAKSKDRPTSVRRAVDTEFDVLHSNGVELIRQTSGPARPGDLLVSLREIDLIAIVRLDPWQLIWSWGSGELERQHHPSMLPNGNILVFDNGVRQKRSRILEVDPRDGRIVWRYGEQEGQHFYSNVRGSVQRLPNGNTLITDSNHGRVFEVTTDGRMVWEFFNPDYNVDKNRRPVIYRMERIALEAIEEFER